MAATATKEREEQTVTIEKEIPAEGQVLVTLFDVDNRHFSNYRTEMTEKGLNDLASSLKTDGQQQNCCGAWVDKELYGTSKRKVIAVYAGFRRIEAMHRNALARVVKEYNEAKNLKPGEEGYIPLGGLGFDSQTEREKIRAAGDDWRTKYDNALKAYPVKFITAIVRDDVHAQLLNMIENEIREDASLLDKLARIDSLVAGGTPANVIAKALKESESAISQYRKLYSVAPALKEMFAGEEGQARIKEALLQPDSTPEEVAEQQNVLLAAVEQFTYRLALPKSSALSISFSHGRDFSGAVLHKTDPLSFRATAMCLKDLVRIKESGEPSETPTMDYGVFKAKLKDYAQQSKKLDATEAAAAAGAETVESLAAAQAATPATAPVPAAPTTAPVPAATAPVSTGKTTPAQTAEEAAKEAEMRAVGQAATEGGTVGEVSDEAGDAALAAMESDATAGDDLESLEADDAALKAAEAALTGEKSAPAPGEEGKSRTKTTEAPEALKYKPLPADKVEQKARGYLTDFNDENNGHVTRAACLLAAMECYHIIGMAEEEQKLNKVYAIYMDSVEEYVKGLIEVATLSLAPEELAKLSVPTAEKITL